MFWHAAPHQLQARGEEKGHRAYEQNEIMHAYGPESSPRAQGLVQDINAQKKKATEKKGKGSSLARQREEDTGRII